MRVAHVVSHPIQYFAPLYRELALRREIDLTVYFYSDASAGTHYDAGFDRLVAWEPDLLDGYHWCVCPSAKGAPLAGAGWLPHLDVVRAVARGRYDVLWAHGYSHVATWLAAGAARARGARLLVREEQTLLHGRPLHRRVAKAILLRALFSQAAGLYIGEQNRRYFARFGVSEDRLYPAPYCVENVALQARAAKLRPRRGDLRTALGVGAEGPVVLFCGKLIEKKQPFVLLEAFRRVRERHPCQLLVVGDGPMRRELEQAIGRDAIPDVSLAGFRSQSELPEAYAAADVFALLSAHDETWGVVVNEAMNFGLPLVVSDKVGSAADLVRMDWNGFVVPHDDVAAAAAALERLVIDPELRIEFGARSLALVDRYSIRTCADGVVAACLGQAAPTLVAPNEVPA